MCGISGIFDYENKSDFSEFEIFTQSLSHRGPEKKRTLKIKQNFFFGHNHLKIIDVSKNNIQPLWDKKKNTV